jgi:predicted tellurium resistance membrane protein TerC
LGGPIVNAAIKAYTAKLAAGNTSERIAADLAARELAVQQKEVEVQAQYKTALIGHPLEPSNLAAYIFVAYFGKVVVYDIMLGLGSTPAIHGAVGEWMAMIAMFLFGKRGIENVARIIRK